MHVTFEHPLNERVRTFLRLEHLFGKVAHFLPQADPWAMRVVVESLLDIVSITSRADIRGELLKELDRNAATLAQFARQPGVDPQALGRVQADLAKAQSGLLHLSGPIGQTCPRGRVPQEHRSTQQYPRRDLQLRSSQFPLLADAPAGAPRRAVLALDAGP